MDRRSVILATAQRNGRVLVDTLAAELGVSPHTIRRDLNALCEDQKLRRIHGGAEFIDGHANTPYSARSVLHHEAKTRIARVVAEMVPDGATVFISIGTTPAVVAHALAPKEALTVVTNNLNAAMALSENSTHRLILPGGEMRLPDRDFLNEEAVRLFSHYRADFAIYGVGGIDTDGSLLDFHEAEVRAREQMRLNARASVLVADTSKFGRRAAAVGGTLSEADHVVLDALPEAPFDTVTRDLDGLIVAHPEDLL